MSCRPHRNLIRAIRSSQIRTVHIVVLLLSLALSPPALSTVLDGRWRPLTAGAGPSEALATLAGGAPANERSAARRIVTWEGEDLDGDGAADIANPVGHPLRQWDAYGSGRFGASRDGGTRHHAGADYVAQPDQVVVAPISGFVTKIGYPYADDLNLRYVEITNPALKISARVFYVHPSVEVGEPVSIRAPIGTAQSLQARYPGGITDHVHLELADGVGHKLDPSRMIFARLEP
jgi:hypothetical protein